MYFKYFIIILKHKTEFKHRVYSVELSENLFKMSDSICTNDDKDLSKRAWRSLQ